MNNKTIRYQVDPRKVDLSMPFDFQYGPDELPDGTNITIVPVDETGTQIHEPIHRQTILVNRGEDGIHWYEALHPKTLIPPSE